MSARDRWFYFTIEFGRFGWSRPAVPTFPRQRNLGVICISYGLGSIKDAITQQLIKDGRGPFRMERGR
ncbi:MULTISPECIES: hypothetical protein [unclassified Acidocella]|uniref:hypothetical protein n=1 Tax=unclassified Acidocella TaxID=2648610 RepID=UPI00028C4522|nr:MULTISPECIES: hypothetical protein [unclassified Acidocella]EKN01094.1 hypothetical protein MXAZACID_02274 [Acidocella sp. MX-AZ02]WBO60577.1 hypothetical protein GT370_07340 [Acidocella sp. MX-AZ03]